MHRIDPGRAHRLGDAGDFVHRIVGAILVQVRAAGGLLQKIGPVARHVQAPVLLLDRRAADRILVGIQVATVKHGQTIHVIIGVVLVLAAGHRVLPIEATRRAIVAVREAIAIGAGSIVVPQVIHHAAEPIEARILTRRAAIVVQFHVRLRVVFHDDRAAAQIRVFRERACPASRRCRP